MQVAHFDTGDRITTESSTRYIRERQNHEVESLFTASTIDAAQHPGDPDCRWVWVQPRPQHPSISIDLSSSVNTYMYYCEHDLELGHVLVATLAVNLRPE